MNRMHAAPMSRPDPEHGQLRACVPGVLRALWLLLACLVMALPAQAETRAWLDRNAVSLGEAVTLNIQTDQPGVAPDFRPLRADFDLGEPYRGAAGSDGTLFGIVMTPLREGVLEVPARAPGWRRVHRAVAAGGVGGIRGGGQCAGQRAGEAWRGVRRDPCR